MAAFCSRSSQTWMDISVTAGSGKQIMRTLRVVKHWEIVAGNEAFGQYPSTEYPWVKCTGHRAACDGRGWQEQNELTSALPPQSAPKCDTGRAQSWPEVPGLCVGVGALSHSGRTAWPCPALHKASVE